MIRFTITSFTLVFFLACGPSKEEHAALLKAHADSVRLATEKRMIKLQELKTSITDLESQEEGMDNRITALRARLEVENDRLGRIKGFQLLRTSDERDQQIHAQVIRIDEVEKDIANTVERKIELGSSISKTKQELATLERENSNTN